MSSERRTLRQSIPSLHGLMLFEASARHLNFSKAATELGISQSAVSHGVKQLEEALGHALFLRENRSLSLTPQGLRLFETVATGFSSIAETIDDICAADQKDTLVVSCSTVMASEWLLPRLPHLRAVHPDLKIDIRCLDRDTDLLAEGIDVQIRLGDGNWPGYEAVRLWPEEIAALASPAYLQRHGPISSLQEIEKHRLILYVDSRRLRLGWAEWLRALGVEWQGRLQVLTQVNDSLAAQRAAETGEGIVLGQFPVVDKVIAEGKLVQVVPETLTTDRCHYALTLETARRRRVVRQFRDWLVGQAVPPPRV